MHSGRYNYTVEKKNSFLNYQLLTQLPPQAKGIFIYLAIYLFIYASRVPTGDSNKTCVERGDGRVSPNYGAHSPVEF